jgi:hypothetical protein
MRAAADIVLETDGLAGIDYVFVARRSTAIANWSVFLESVRTAVAVLNRKISKKTGSGQNHPPLVAKCKKLS